MVGFVELIASGVRLPPGSRSFSGNADLGRYRAD
jgi:hypothetical protein